MSENLRYLNDFRTFRKDFSRTIALTWSAGKTFAIINFCLLLLQAICPVASFYFIKKMVELMVPLGKTDFHAIIPSVIGFSVAQFLLAVASQFSAYINTMQQQKLTNHIAGMVHQKAIEVDLEYYENPAYHDTLHMAQQQSQYQVPQLLSNINNLVLNSLSLIFLVSFFFTLQWVYASVFILLSIPLAAIKWYYGYMLFKLERKYIPKEREANYYHDVLTRVSYAKEVRSLGIGNLFMQRFKHIRDTIYHEKKGLNFRFTCYSLVAQVVEVIIMVVIFVLLAKNAWAGLITIGVFVIYLQGFQRLQSASKNFLQSLVQIFQQRLFLKDIFMFFDIPARASVGKEQFPALSKGLLAENLSFTYPHTGRQVLHNVSVSCKPGSIIAIVGENGSGKSTLVKLLARLYETQSGSIKIEDADLANISVESFREHAVFLFQDFEKYFLTIEENITLAGSLKKGSGAIETAAELAVADTFINAFPDKYKTRLGRIFHKSEQLSGGQWQKLALARTFYKNAQLIVLDEPTSNIDALAEYELFKNLKAHAAGKMVILISHRLYNLKLADHIYVMSEGKVAESGTFEELIRKEGIFSEMYNKQKL